VVVVTLTNGQIINLQGATLGTLGDWLNVGHGAPGETMFGADTGAITLTGGSGPDVFADGAASAVITGGSGNDTFWGGGGSDFLYGGDGQDRLIGQAGTDLLTGGAGGDQFFITPDGGDDWIADFSKAAGDRVMLAAGVTFSMQQFEFGVGVALSTGQAIGIQGATVAGLGADWFGYF
jgi:Ca2+-binding RTX toxin-like protein